MADEHAVPGYQIDPNERNGGENSANAATFSTGKSRANIFVQFVAKSVQDSRKRPPESSEEALRLELLIILEHLFSTGYPGPSSQYELIGLTWIHIVERCDSPLLCTAEKLWLDFEETEPNQRLRSP